MTTYYEMNKIYKKPSIVLDGELLERCVLADIHMLRRLCAAAPIACYMISTK